MADFKLTNENEKHNIYVRSMGQEQNQNISEHVKGTGH